MYFRQKDSKPPSLPYFIHVFPNGTLYGLGTQADIGTFVIECVGVDDAGWETPIEFSLAVKRKFFILIFQLVTISAQLAGIQIITLAFSAGKDIIF